MEIRNLGKSKMCMRAEKAGVGRERETGKEKEAIKAGRGKEECRIMKNSDLYLTKVSPEEN